MLCFRDMTFCQFHEDCADAKICHRPLTAEVLAAAEKWWGSENVPICQFAERPTCHKPK